MVGSRATRSREPGQARKGAAVSGVPGVPRECPAGAGYRASAGPPEVQDGPHGLLSTFFSSPGVYQTHTEEKNVLGSLRRTGKLGCSPWHISPFIESTGLRISPRSSGRSTFPERSPTLSPMI